MVEVVPEYKDYKEATPDEVLLAIGRFIYAFSFLESHIRRVIAQRIKLDDSYFESVISHDFAMLLTVLHEVFNPELLPEEEAKELASILSTCRALNDLRVKVVHGMWSLHKKGGTILHIRRQNLRSYKVPWMADTLEEDAKTAWKTTKRLEEFCAKHCDL